VHVAAVTPAAARPPRRRHRGGGLTTWPRRTPVRPAANATRRSAAPGRGGRSRATLTTTPSRKRPAPPGHRGGGNGAASATPWPSLSAKSIPARSAASATRRTAAPGRGRSVARGALRRAGCPPAVGDASPKWPASSGGLAATSSALLPHSTWVRDGAGVRALKRPIGLHSCFLRAQKPDLAEKTRPKVGEFLQGSRVQITVKHPRVFVSIHYVECSISRDWDSAKWEGTAHGCPPTLKSRVLVTFPPPSECWNNV
jgi:hypothetical protein